MVQALEEILAKSSRIVFFGGAGVSTESGIPDFRSVDGLYHQKYDYPPETILSHTFWEQLGNLLRGDAASNRLVNAPVILDITQKRRRGRRSGLCRLGLEFPCRRLGGAFWGFCWRLRRTMQEHHNSPAETGDESALLILHSKIHCLFEQGVLDGVAAPGLVLDVIGEDIVVTDCGGGVPLLARSL